MKKLLATTLCLLAFQPAFAAKIATDGRIDPRIKHVTYNERDVVVVHGHYGYSTHIVFAEGEEITHLSPGDSLAWQIVPKQNHLFLKPMENDAETNLSVLTNVRQYNFELRANEARNSADTSLSFVVKFNYPREEMQRALAASRELAKKQEAMRETEVIPGHEFSAKNLNFDYSMKGSDELAPVRTFDDGQFTYFQFPEEIDTPAIFLVDKEKKESIVNFHVKGKFIVIQRIGKQFILRNGDMATCIFNEGYELRTTPSELPEVAVMVDDKG